MKTSLVIDARAISGSGIGVYLRRLLPFILSHPGFSVRLLGCAAEIEEALGGSAPGRAAIIECGAGMYTLREQVQVPLKVPRCGIFWSPHYNVPLLPVRARHRVVTIHDVYHLAFLRTLKPIEKLYAGTVLPLAARLSERVITVSSFSCDEIVRYTGIGRDKIAVIHNGVDEPAPARAVPGDLPVPPGRYLLYVGNVKPHKNVVGLIHAFAQFHGRFPDVRLVIAGRKDGFVHGIKGLDELISGLGLTGWVVFTGYVQDEVLSGLYERASALAFPSFYEGFGLPPLEAMAHGVPVIASRAASIPEVCGDAALFVDPHDREDIARALCRVFSDDGLRAELVRRGGERVKGFSWRISAERHLELFEELSAADRNFLND